jgi:hypothetical protein
MKEFNVITYDFNRSKFEKYDIMPYFKRCYYEIKKKGDRPKTYDECKKFIISESNYRYNGRCEWEIILVDWPCKRDAKKIDVHDQIMNNLDIVVSIFRENLGIND